MCLGWLIFCPDRVQIPELWGNSDFISPFLYLDISLQKTKKALKNQGFLWRYLFYRPLMVAGVGLEPHGLRVMSPTSYHLLYPAINMKFGVVPVTGLEPVRYSRITGF